MVLAVRERGAGRPIVLLPWFGLDGGVTELAFEPAFAEPNGLRRIYVDLPGTGRSAAVAPSSDAVLEAVRETVDAALGPDPYLLAGCSYGGYLAAALARRDPERVQGLLLVCAGPQTATWRGSRLRPRNRIGSTTCPSSCVSTSRTASDASRGPSPSASGAPLRSTGRAMTSTSACCDRPAIASRTSTRRRYIAARPPSSPAGGTESSATSTPSTPSTGTP